MNLRIRTELSVMMFLQFFIWGAWFVTMGTFLGKGLGFEGTDIGSAYSTTAWAAIVSPFFIGMIADRFFPAQIVLGVMHLLGAVLMYVASTMTTPGTFFWVLLAYALCYMPTLALVNAISFHQMTNPEKEFPPIRVLGTLGWIVAGLMIMALGRARLTNIEATAIPMRMAAACSLLLGVYSFFLPNTPPKATGKKVSVRDVLGLDALRLMKERSFAIFVICSLLVCIPLGFYYNFTNLFLNESGIKDVVGKMTMGQMSEVFFMLVMPFFFVRLGVKKMLLVGMAAWALRYVLFAVGNNDPLTLPLTADQLLGAMAMVSLFYLGILLHGVCYDFFFVAGQIYVDNVAPEEIRANAQGLIAMITYGAGMVIGAKISGLVVEYYQIMEAGEVVGHAWPQVWVIPVAMAVVVIVLFALLFREETTAEDQPATP